MDKNYKKAVKEFNDVCKELGLYSFIKMINTSKDFKDWSRQQTKGISRKAFGMDISDTIEVNWYAIMNKLMSNSYKKRNRNEWVKKFGEKLTRLGNYFDSEGDILRGDWTFEIAMAMNKHYGSSVEISL